MHPTVALRDLPTEPTPKVGSPRRLRISLVPILALYAVFGTRDDALPEAVLRQLVGPTPHCLRLCCAKRG